MKSERIYQCLNIIFGILCIFVHPSAAQTLHNSGTHAKGTSYTISNCNTGSYYISIQTAWYGYGSCYASSATSIVQTSCNAQTTCTVSFTQAVFGDPCTQVESGYVKWYCARNGGWGNWGTWTACSLLCGTGTKTRSRSCDNPTRVSPGTDCSGSTSDSTNCNTNSCPTNQLLTAHRGPWRLVFKAPNYVQATGYSDIYTFYQDTGSLHDQDVTIMRDFAASGQLYKSSILDNWGSTVSVSAVRLSAYKSGAEAAYVVFNGFGKTKSTFMDCTDIIDSTWTDISSETRNYCQLTSADGNKRNFFINRLYGGCSVDTGWFMFKDYGSTGGCAAFDSSTDTAPFVRYTTGTTYSTWETSSVKGDSMAIFVLEWHMVFKGVQGVTSAEGSLENLWKGSNTENEDDLTTKTITKSPSKTYKSGIVESWSNAFIDQVKYAFFNSGKEVAWIVFNGRSTTKDTWLTDSQVLFSRYTDLTTSMAVDSISGDGTRAFALIQTTGACSAYSAWMFALDNPSGATTCSFDNNVQTRPYFLYSSGTTRANPESSGSWNSAGFPSAETLGIFIKGWYTVFKVAKSQSVSPGSSVLDLWQGTHTLNDHDANGQSFSGTTTYKSAIVDQWNSYYIKAVRVSIIVSGVEVAYIVFDAHGTDKNSWFTCARILYTSFTDLNRDTTVLHCSVTGDSTNNRHFFLESYYNGCSGDTGWFVVVEDSTPSCSYESKVTLPYTLYSSTNRATTNEGMAVADAFAISIDMENYCNMVTCNNGGTCYERGFKFECVCAGTYYGTFCDDRDGNWTTWTDWSACPSTCYVYGPQTRSRSCTNPTKVANGTDCPGDASDSTNCLPDFQICPEYNTGDIDEGGTYTMICPSGRHILVTSAHYFNTTNSCSDTDATLNVRTLCHGKTTCTITFNDALFGDPCASYAKKGNATMFCAENQMLSTHRGPWRMVFKVPAGVAPTGYNDVWEFYSSTGSLNEDNVSIMTNFGTSGGYFKSSFLDEWGVTKSVSAVRLSVYNSGQEVVYITFDTTGLTKDTWMDCSRIVESNYVDIIYENQTTCDFNSSSTALKRRFFISKSQSDCTSAEGWLFLKDNGATSGCADMDPTSHTMPYIVYSTDRFYTKWSTGNKAFGDSLVISVLEWDMVFKGIDGVVPSTTSLQSLWEGTDTSNDGNSSAKTLTQSPGQIYKDAIVENWATANVEKVKLSFATDGLDVAWVVFDGRGTTKSSWFADSKILYSSFTDLQTGSTVSCGVGGDGTRSFAIIKTAGTCAAHTAWMMALDDPSASRTCSWDNDVRGRPYFLYSNSENAVLCESSSAWNSVSFPAAEVMVIGVKGWFPVMKVARGESISPATSIYDLWTGQHVLNEFETEALSFSSGSMSYKSSIVNNWENYYIASARLGFYQSGVEKAFIVFDAQGTNSTSWLDCNRILYTSWNDLSRDVSPEYCSVQGNSAAGRHFYAQYDEDASDCNNDHGWFSILEGSSVSCSWETKTTRPYALFSDASGYEHNNNMAIADVVAVSIILENFCSSSPCVNGTCKERASSFECVCDGTYYGITCDRRDGNWTDWTEWGSCSSTCYALGLQERSRNCTNPTPDGGMGLNCSTVDGGNELDTRDCFLDLPVCELYSTGKIYETDTTTSYRMICPEHHVAMVMTGYYGTDDCSYQFATRDLRLLCDGNINCTIPFVDSTFGTPCASSSNYGNATLKCLRSLEVFEHKGTWNLAMKIPSGTQATGHTDILSFITSDDTLNSDSVTAMRDFSSNSDLFKSSILYEWGINRTVSAVKLAVIKSNAEVANLVFDVKGLSLSDWFNCSNIIESSWNDITFESQDFCRIKDDDDNSKRNFYISKNESSCTEASGWLVLKDYGATTGCSEWDSTGTAMPYILYSTGETATTWATGSVGTADALAIYLMDWHMVFKGVEGQTPTTAATLQGLWEGTGVENDDSSFATLTTTSTATYKSATINDWGQQFLEHIKVGLFTGGHEVAWTVFDGRASSSTNWFADSKIKYSYYTDLQPTVTSSCGISGDGTRRFAMIDTAGSGCSTLKAWMMVIDDGGQTCSWDKNVRSRPYFLYSANPTSDFPESASSWSSASFPAAEVLGVFAKGWFPVMKVAQGQDISPGSSILDLWSGNHGAVNEFESDGFSFSSTMTYRSSMIDSWNNYYINAVRISVIVGGVEVAFIVFDANGGVDKLTWFDCSRLLYTSYSDLMRGLSLKDCSVAGDPAESRHFFLSYEYEPGSCDKSYGWFGVIERTTGGCNWEQKAVPPYVLYSDAKGHESHTDMAIAGAFAVSIDMDDFCSLEPCQMNSTCVNRASSFECVCNGTFYGIACEQRDGNWTEWMEWSTCSATCYSVTTQSRSRTCTNPFPVGNKGINCSSIDGGHDSETRECVSGVYPCPTYNTGVIAAADTTNVHKAVCPTSRTVMILEASYGSSSCTDSTALKDLRDLCNGNVNCTITFSDAAFGNPCPATANSGYATYKCVKDAKLTQHRGPWRLAFKILSGQTVAGFPDIMSFYKDAASLNDESVSAMVDFSTSSDIFKSSVLSQWGTNRSISAIKLAVIKSNVEMAYVTVAIDRYTSTKEDWLNCSNILESSWVDLDASTEPGHCSLETLGSTTKRNFYIAQNHTECITASGWLVLKDYGATDGCSEWDSTGTTMPYILYSGDDMAVTWATGNKQTADALAVYVMDWDMVFKGVEGVVPSAVSSLQGLWAGSLQENDNDDAVITLTSSPNKAFKSIFVDQWAQYGIDMIKHSNYKQGHEVAWVVFDGRGTTKDNWFDGSKILYSSYSDITTAAKAHSSITGDGTHVFALMHATSAVCSDVKAWMLVVDNPGSSVKCSWDNNVATRPYFLYSDSDTWASPDSSGSWAQAAFPTAEVLGVFVKGWFPVFKVARGQSVAPASGIYDLWTGSHGGVNEFEDDAASFSASTMTYRSSLIDNWGAHYIEAVKITFVVSNQEVATVAFDAHGSDKNTWHSSDRILYTTYNDLHRLVNPEYFSIAGESANSRYFYAAYNVTDCDNTYGWYGVMEKTTAGCTWEAKATPPFAIFSDNSAYENMKDFALADVFYISVAMADYCVSQPCLNNATCYDRGTTFECICNGTFYGINCAHRDGNWTEWSDWATCSTTCWALGSHSRTRTCTNPFPVGAKGVDCSGIDGGQASETKECIPDLPVCPSYSTGTIATTASPNTYQMVCPTSHFTSVVSVFYGHSTCTDSTSLSDLRWFCVGKINCTVTFSNSIFGNECHTSASYGQATLKCVESMQLTEHRGPWTLALKIPSGKQATGYPDIASFYADSGSLNDGSISDMVDFSSGGNLFKSSLLEYWNWNLSISAARLSVIKSNVEVAYIVFDTAGRNKTSILDCGNILDSSWKDIAQSSKDHCAISDTGAVKRHFYMSKNDTLCTEATGWLVLKDYGYTGGCTEWDDNADAKPRIMYSGDKIAVNWASGNVQTADALALYIMEWKTIFRGVQGSVPSSASSLENLWTGSTQENDNDISYASLTASPAGTYKSIIVDQWDQYQLEQIKLGYFTNGMEVSWVVLNGLGTTKSNWLDSSRIRYGMYSDIVSSSKAVCSIPGDGTRAFALIHETSGTCANVKAWMMAIDKAGGPTTCSWDNNLKTRPYFLYSNGSTWGYPESAGTWAEGAFPMAETMGVFIKGWYPLMKVAHGQSISPATGIYNMWAVSHGGINEFEYDAFSLNPSTPTLRSKVIDNWQSVYIKAVKVATLLNGQEQATIVFDAFGSDKLSWFDCSRILYTNFLDLNRDVQPEYCSIVGESGANRRFFVAYDVDTCSNSYGWFGVADGGSSCSFDTLTTTPYAFYSSGDRFKLLTGASTADVFSISVDIGDYCASAPCENNATCYDRGTRFECICNGTFYGMVCEHRDGNWTQWSDWATCSTTCWALGSHSRTRTCTEPFPVGTKGINCDAIDGGQPSETKECIPDLGVCSSYATSNIYETASPNTYRMVCPTSHFTMVMSAFYGHGSCSDPNALWDLRTFCDGKINCTISFTDSTFGDPCPSSSNYGSAVLKCVESITLNEDRGPWSLVFKAPSGTQATGYDDIFSFYSAPGSFNDDNLASMTDFSSGSALYKSSWLDDWGTKVSFQKLKVSVYKGNVEVAFITFDTALQNKMSWMDCSRIVDSNFLDIEETIGMCEMNGTDTNKRSFAVNKNDSDCSTASGWLLLKDYSATSGCGTWDSTGTSMPYILYSKDTTAVQWSSGNKEYGDCLAIFVSAWDMVFKGVQGVVPAAGSLKTLWEGTTTVNPNDDTAITVSKSPSKTFKSGIVEKWDDLNIEQVRLGHYQGGQEVSWVVFDGRDKNKNGWLSGTTILYSKYTDIKTLSKAVASISGDGKRTFQLFHATGTCANVQAWMMAVDNPSGSQTCTWDANVLSRPYFLYSNADTVAYPQLSSAWNSALFPTAEVMGVFVKGWFPAMKVARGQSLEGASSILDLWTGTYTVNEWDEDALNYDTGSKTFKSSLVDNWTSNKINGIKVSLHQGGIERQFAVFDGHGTDKLNWFDCNRLLYTSYSNLNRHVTPDYCSIAGESGAKRHFFAQYSLTDCASSYGWFGLIERTTTGCSWESKTTRPYALYSDDSGYELNDNMAVAEVFAISVAIDNFCDSTPCKNNATCLNREISFECICNDTFYGMDCAHRDGNWSTWADWGTCSTTCYSIGTHTRTRSCTDPFPVGDGIVCTGIDWQIKECIAELGVCTSYDTGNVTQGTSYLMICPPTHYILVDSGWYGNDIPGGVTLTFSYYTYHMVYWKVGNDTHSRVDSTTHYYDVNYDCIDENALYDLRTLCHRKINCTILFNDALFGGDPCPTKTKYGSASMQCVEHIQPTQFRGPWTTVFKISSGTQVPGYNDLASLYWSTDTYNDGKDSVMTDLSAGSDVYKSSVLDEWNTKRSINAVRLSVFKNNEEVQWIDYYAGGRTKNTWMDCSNVIDSSWYDVHLTDYSNFCSISGFNETWKRNFFVSKKTDPDCNLDSGWVMVKDYGSSTGCGWDSASSPTPPYIMYSPNNYYVNWTSGDALYADALTISVMEWNMAFKGVQGVTPSAGSLGTLWNSTQVYENEDDPTARTVTKAPGKVIKEKIIDLWDDYTFLEMAKYSFFNDGQEVAYTVFDTRGDMSNMAFFTDSKILFSSYSDIKSFGKRDIGLFGDGIRSSLLAKDLTDKSCSAFEGWMFILDSNGGSKPCSFDNDVVTRPYFLYSDNGTVFKPELSGSWNSASFPSAEVMALFLKGWFPVMRVTMGQDLGNATSILDLWTGNHIINEWDFEAVKHTSTKTYKSSIPDNWGKYFISAARVSFFDASSPEVEKAFAVFDARGSTKLTWFQCNRLLYTNYYDLSPEVKPAYCSIDGDTSHGKHFLIQYSYNNCSDYGWFGLIEKNTDPCSSYVTKNTLPFGLFSTAQGYDLNDNMQVANKMMISVALRGYCESTPCQYGSTCYDRVGRFECVCDGTYYGMICQNRDGNWTEWTEWDTCTTTCYAVGTQERYRNCTNPTTVGDGIYCPYEDWQIRYCVPTYYPICAEYNTGDMNGTYQMVCPEDHYIYVDSAFFGYVDNGTTTCSDSDAKTDLENICQGSVNCTFDFTSVVFNQPCTGYKPYGNAKLYCARDGQWTNWEAWTWCPVTCAGGLRSRDRYCTNPTRVKPGLDCPDLSNEKKACLTDPCPVCGDHTSGYDTAINISVLEDTKSGVGFLMLDVNWEIHCCEVISNFEFFPRDEGFIEFQIWRKINSQKYQLVNLVNYTVSASEVGTVVNVTLPLKQRLAANQWDVIGWYTPGVNIINYAPCQGELCPTMTRRLVMAQPSMGDSVDWLSTGTSTRLKNRAYAIRFTTHPNTLPFLNQTVISVLAKDSSPIGTSVIDYTMQEDDVGDSLTHSFTHYLFELNTTFEHLGLIHIQTTGKLPSTYKVFELIGITSDTCHHTVTTTLEVITYNAPPVLHNLPNKIDLSEATSESIKIFDVDAKDYSENDSVCCTLAQVIPGSLNFQLKFSNQVYSLWTVDVPVFDYAGISNYYKLWVCCSDGWGVTANFLEIDIENVIEKVEYIPPTWFLTAIAASMVPITITFIAACAVLCATFFCDAEIEYYYE